MPIFLEEFRMKEQSRGRKNVGTLGHLSFKREEEIGSEQKSGNFLSSCTQCCRRYMEVNRNKKTHLAVHLKRTGFDFSLSCIGIIFYDWLLPLENVFKLYPCCSMLSILPLFCQTLFYYLHVLHFIYCFGQYE